MMTGNIRISLECTLILLMRSVSTLWYFEVERLKERAQSAANFVSEQSKTKSGKKKTNKRKDPPKPSKSESEASPGPSAKKKKAHHGKKPSNGSKTKAKCHRCGEPGHFARDCTKPKKVSYCNSATLVCSQSLMVGSDSPLLWVVDSGESDHIACNKDSFGNLGRFGLEKRNCTWAMISWWTFLEWAPVKLILAPDIS